MGKFDSLQDKVVVIAGGAKNLGGLLSTTYAKEGAKLVIHHHDENSLDDAKATLTKVENLGGEGTLFSGDLTKVSNVQALFQHAEETFGKVDIAINTVGKVLKKPISETTEEEFDSMADINAKSAYFFIKYAEKAMNDHGKIITLATALLAAYTGFYSTMLVAKHLLSNIHAQHPQNLWIEDFSKRCRSRANGYAILLSTRRR